MQKPPLFNVSKSISKIDITDAVPSATDVVTGLSDGPFGIALNGSDLYIAEHFANKISKIDITDATPTAIDVVTGLNTPASLVLKGSDLYIAEFNGNKISKFSLSTLSTDKFSLSQSVTAFPNPSTSFIQISGLTKTENYIIYSVLGAEIKNGKISDNGKIEIQNLTNGLYFLKFDNGSTLNFLKK